MMLSLRRQAEQGFHSRESSPFPSLWLFLSFEFLAWLGVSVLLRILAALKSLLPPPPRDLTGDVVLITGACSSLGESLSTEFARAGCAVVCVDEDGAGAEGLASRLPSQKNPRAYGCDLRSREDIRGLAARVGEEIGPIDVLLTCTDTHHEDIFLTAGGALASHYWTILAFLPSMLSNDRARVVGIMPWRNTGDAYRGASAAVAGLTESLAYEFGRRSGHVTFLTATPQTERRRRGLSERQLARDVVRAVQRDQSSVTLCWSSRVYYQVSRVLHTTITAMTQWMCPPGCDNLS